ncbi:MAG: hypothetical protein HQM08_02690 [Candidatus Riflebacteria bacterium]|nr:hypothetical protein [Candidatus Riflebacteria bacterium]
MNRMNQLFDRDQMIQVAREGMENAFRFFMTFNENVVKMTQTQREVINETTKKSLEVVNKAYEEYQKNNRIITSHIENFCQEMTEKACPKETTQD